MSRDLSKLNIFQVIYHAAKDGFCEGHECARVEAEYDRQLRAEEISALRARRAKHSDPDRWR